MYGGGPTIWTGGIAPSFYEDHLYVVTGQLCSFFYYPYPTDPTQHLLTAAPLSPQRACCLSQTRQESPSDCERTLGWKRSELEVCNVHIDSGWQCCSKGALHCTAGRGPVDPTRMGYGNGILKFPLDLASVEDCFIPANGVFLDNVSAPI